MSIKDFPEPKGGERAHMKGAVTHQPKADRPSSIVSKKPMSGIRNIELKKITRTDFSTKQDVCLEEVPVKCTRGVRRPLVKPDGLRKVTYMTP